MGYLQTSQIISASQKEVFDYVTDLGNLPETLAGVMEVEFPVSLPLMRPLAEAQIIFKRYGFPCRVLVRVDEYARPERFTYRQLEGFFQEWHHTQIFEAHNSNRTRLTDIISFKMPLGLFGSLADDLFVRRDLDRVLRHRYDRIMAYFENRV